MNGLDNVTRYIVNGVKNEPNLLGWYVSDENPLTQLPDIRKLRQLISENDPYHPTMTLTDLPINMIDFSMTGDYLMSDPYPVGTRSSGFGEKQSMKACRDALDVANQTGIPVLWVPQVFAWGSFQKGIPH